MAKKSCVGRIISLFKRSRGQTNIYFSVMLSPFLGINFERYTGINTVHFPVDREATFYTAVDKYAHQRG